MDEELKIRKSPRLKKYDYSRPGYYFITMCTHDKIKILSKVIKDENGKWGVALTTAGVIVDEIINSLPERFSIKIHKYIIMPNHIHFIMIVNNTELLKATRRNPEHHRKMIDEAVGYIKMNASKRIHREFYEGKIWQRSYHDHIIRSEFDYGKIWSYINTNPSCWSKDQFYIE